MEMAIQLKKSEEEFKNRGQFEVALACAYFMENGGYSKGESLNYDSTTCDVYCLREELMQSFDLEEEDVEYTIEDEIN